MAQLLTAPPSVNFMAAIPDQGKDPKAPDAARIDAETGSGSTFAAVLKTTSEKIQLRSGHQPPSAHDPSVPAISIKAGRILTSLHADASLKLKDTQPSLAAIPADLTAPENLATTSLFVATLDTPQSGLVVTPTAPAGISESLADAQSIKAAADGQPVTLGDSVDRADDSLLAAPMVEEPAALVKASTKPGKVSGATPADQLQEPLTASMTGATAANAGLINAVSPAPTLASNKVERFPQNVQKAPAGRSVDILPESGLVADKFAAKAAIAAETGKFADTSFLKESGSGDFSALVDRGVQTSAFTAISPGNATHDMAAPGLKLETPLGQAGWRDEFGQKLTWMVSNTRQQAELILNPPQLGRIEVTLALDGDKASASFFSPHAAVREALENSMARLREVLAESGVTLGQTHVGEDSRQNSGLTNPKHEQHILARGNSELNFPATDTAPGGGRNLASAGRGMVDIFA